MRRANSTVADELTILKQFFGSRVTSENCDAFKAIFDVADRASTPAAGENQATRLQTIWNQLPSRINPDFAGMDNQARNNYHSKQNYLF